MVRESNDLRASDLLRSGKANGTVGSSRDVPVVAEPEQDLESSGIAGGEEVKDLWTFSLMDS